MFRSIVILPDSLLENRMGFGIYKIMDLGKLHRPSQQCKLLKLLLKCSTFSGFVLNTERSYKREGSAPLKRSLGSNLIL